MVLHEANCRFPVENPESCWTWAFAVVEFVHKLPGVAVVSVDYDQFGTHYSNPTLFLHLLQCLHSFAEPARQKAGAQMCLKGHCWFQGESRLLASLTSLYPPSLASLFASLVRKSLDLEEKSGRVCEENTPMAACDYDAGRPCPLVGPFVPPGPWLNFHVIQEPAADLPLRAVLSGKNAVLMTLVTSQTPGLLLFF